MSLYMRPCLPIHCISDSRTRNAKFISNILMSHTVSSHFSDDRDIRLSKFCGTVPCAFGHLAGARLREAAPAVRHLLHVFRAVSPRQMLGIAAKGVVTTVKRPWLPFWRGTMFDLAGHSIRSGCCAIQPKLPISVWPAGCFPRPTIIRSANFNFFPKSSDILFGHVNLGIVRSPAILHWGNKNVWMD
jgi:hypothetical protein